MRRSLVKKLAIVAFAAAFSSACVREERSSTPLPTRQSTIDRVHKGLESADQDAAKRRQSMDEAANK
jgi:hypothetical protein